MRSSDEPATKQRKNDNLSSLNTCYMRPASSDIRRQNCEDNAEDSDKHFGRYDICCVFTRSVRRVPRYSGNAEAECQRRLRVETVTICNRYNCFVHCPSSNFSKTVVLINLQQTGACELTPCIKRDGLEKPDPVPRGNINFQGHHKYS
jgi:hypothetical protein